MEGDGFRKFVSGRIFNCLRSAYFDLSPFPGQYEQYHIAGPIHKTVEYIFPDCEFIRLIGDSQDGRVIRAFLRGKRQWNLFRRYT